MSTQSGSAGRARASGRNLRFEPFTRASASRELDELRRELRSVVRRISGRGVEQRHRWQLQQLALVPDELAPDVREEFECAEQMAQRSAHETIAGTRSVRAKASPCQTEVVAAEGFEDDTARSILMPPSPGARLLAADLDALVEVFRLLDTWKKETQ